MAIVFRTLKHAYRLVTQGDRYDDQFAFMAIEPEIADTDLIPVELQAEYRHGYFSLTLPEGRAEGTAAHLLAVMHDLIWNDVVASEHESVFLHGATVLGPWGRALLVGNKGAGKSTLALHLVATGHRIEGDEHLIVRAGSVIARPRTLRIKPGTLRHVPAVAEAVARQPHVLTWDSMPIYSVAPSLCGQPWRIEAGSLDRLVFLDANHGGRSAMATLPAKEALRRLMAQALLPPRVFAAGFLRLQHLTQTVPCFRLSLGDLPGAVRELHRLA